MRAIALYSCTAEDPVELTFKVGQLILDVRPADEQGWFMGRLEGSDKLGLLPGNFVRFEEDPPGPPLRAQFTGQDDKVASSGCSTSVPATAIFGEAGSPTTRSLSLSRKLDPQATRKALMERSNVLAHQARDKTVSASVYSGSLSRDASVVIDLPQSTFLTIEHDQPAPYLPQYTPPSLPTRIQPPTFPLGSKPVPPPLPARQLSQTFSSPAYQDTIVTTRKVPAVSSLSSDASDAPAHSSPFSPATAHLSNAFKSTNPPTVNASSSSYSIHADAIKESNSNISISSVVDSNNSTVAVGLGFPRRPLPPSETVVAITVIISIVDGLSSLA
ncbi:hypothetical protein BSLG_008641 [Batrachochytrium salamandrivorans]|nr:hypothetical protein BSLG_008641 [Batrachochytrium salamandrivorans]